MRCLDALLIMKREEHQDLFKYDMFDVTYTFEDLEHAALTLSEASDEVSRLVGQVHPSLPLS